MPPYLEDLPEELLDNVIRFMNHKGSLCALVRVSQHFFRLAIPHLYRHVSFGVRVRDDGTLPYVLHLLALFSQKAGLSTQVHSFSMRRAVSLLAHMERLVPEVANQGADAGDGHANLDEAEHTEDGEDVEYDDDYADELNAEIESLRQDELLNIPREALRYYKYRVHTSNALELRNLNNWTEERLA